MVLLTTFSFTPTNISTNSLTLSFNWNVQQSIQTSVSFFFSSNVLQLRLNCVSIPSRWTVDEKHSPPEASPEPPKYKYHLDILDSLIPQIPFPEPLNISLGEIRRKWVFSSSSRVFWRMSFLVLDTSPTEDTGMKMGWGFFWDDWPNRGVVNRKREKLWKVGIA